ncbi:MAG: hypothetical protein ACKORG_08905 [Actinomycetota bacterium]
MPVGVRNAVIILGLAALVVWWERAFTVALATASQVLSVLFVVAILAAGVAYFRRNPLAWLVMKPWQRVLVVVAALGIAFLLIAGYPLLADRITPFGYLALIVALGLLIWWIIRDSRRL